MQRVHTWSRVLDWLDGAISVRSGQPCGDDQERNLRAVPGIDLPERDGRVVVQAVLGRLLLPSRQQPRAAGHL